MVKLKISPKDAWARIKPRITEVTNASFNLKVERKDFVTIIHLPDDNFIEITQDNIFYPVNISPNTVNVDLTDLCQKEFLAHETYPIDYLKTRFLKGWLAGYNRRAHRNLMFEVLKALPPDVLKLSYRVGRVFFRSASNFGSSMKNLELIFMHKEKLIQIEKDDPRCLPLFYCTSLAKVDVKDGIKKIKETLLGYGLTEAGWRYILKMNCVEKAMFSAERLDFSVALINLITAYQVNLRFHGMLTIALRYPPILQKIYLRRAAHLQKNNHGRLGRKLFYNDEVIGQIGYLLDFLDNYNGLIPKDAGYHWLKKKSDAWHREIGQKQFESEHPDGGLDWTPKIYSKLGRDALFIKTDQFSARMLTTTKDFYDESNQMHHCISSRWKDASTMKSCYFHLELINEKKPEQASLEVVMRNSVFSVSECRGKYNAPISKPMSDFAKFVAKQLKFRVH